MCGDAAGELSGLVFSSCSLIGCGTSTAGDPGARMLGDADRSELRPSELAGDCESGLPNIGDLADNERLVGRATLSSSEECRFRLLIRPLSSRALDLNSQSGTTWRLKSSETSGISTPSVPVGRAGPVDDLFRIGREPGVGGNDAEGD